MRKLIYSFLTLTTLSGVAFAQDPSLVGWWRFNETSGTAVADSSGYGNNGILVGAFSRVPGKVSANAINFGGTSHVHNATPDVGFAAGAGPRTMAAWVKFPGAATGMAIVLDQDDDFSMNITGSGTLLYALTGLTRLDDGGWHHVAGVYSGQGANWLLYVDGQLDQIGMSSDAVNTISGGSWTIGSQQNGQQGFPGVMDDVRYYNRALAQSEIQAIVTGDGGTLGPVPVDVSQTVNSTTCAPKPGITILNYGDLSNCSVAQAGEIREFQFQAHAGEQIWLDVQRTSGNTIHCFQITEPDGTADSLTCVPYNFFGNAADLIQEQFLTKDGTYIIQISAQDGQNGTFPFLLGLKREVPLPQQIPQMTFGVATVTELLNPFDWHYFSANGTAGDKLTVSYNRLTTNVQHCVAIYAPDGEIVFNQCAPYNFFGNPTSVSTTLTLTETGGYIFRVSGDYHTGFEYSLAVNCVGTCSNAPVAPPSQTCNYYLSPPTELLSSAAAAGELGISASQGCPWSVSSSGSFLTILTPPTGGGSAEIGFVVTPNTAAAARTAVVSVGGLTSTITQLGASPLLAVTPTPLTFSLTAGATAPSSQLLSIFTSQPLNYTASVTMDIAPALNWLTISSTSGSAPSSLAVTVNPSILPPGTLTGSVTISSPTASPAQVKIPISVTLQTGGAAAVSVDSNPITFSLMVGGPSALVQRTVSNTGAGFLAFTASVENPTTAPWLSVSPAGGSVSLTTPENISISASPAGLIAGTYSSSVLVAANGKVTRIPVTMTVGTAGAMILLSQTGLTFNGVAGGGNPSPQTFGILNSGIGSLHWTATASTLSGGSWLSLDTTLGTVNRPLLDVSLVNVSVNTSQLGAGQYYGKIEIDGDALNTPQFITVVASVLPNGSNPGPDVRPSGLIFIGPPGRSAGAQPVNITNIIGQPVAFTSSQLTFDGGKWLSQSPLTATVNPNSPGTMSVQSDNTTTAAGGILRGVVTLLFQDGRSTTVNVLNVVAAGAPSPSVRNGGAAPELTPANSSCKSPTLEVQLVSLRAGFQAFLGQPATISAKIADDCGNALVPDSSAATPVTASFSNGDPVLNMVSEGNGQWSGTWTPSRQPSNGSSATVTIHAAYLTVGSNQTLQTGTAQVIGSLLSSNSSPLITPGSLVHAASDIGSSPVSPGEIISIFGSNFATQVSAAPGTPLPTNLNDTEVVLGNVSLPLLYTSTGQINAQVPFELPVNSQSQVTVRRGTALSVPQQITVAAAQPGIFALDQAGTGQGIIFKSDGVTLAGTGTPAQVGETVVIYAAGLGAVTPNVADGAPAPSTPPATTVNPVTVTIGGVPASVAFAGLTPGLAGLYQVNAVVPQGVTTGNAVSVSMSVAGQTSNTVTMAIQ